MGWESNSFCQNKDIVIDAESLDWMTESAIRLLLAGEVLCMKGKAIVRLDGACISKHLIEAVEYYNATTKKGTRIKMLSDRMDPQGFWRQPRSETKLTRPEIEDLTKIPGYEATVYIHGITEHKIPEVYEKLEKSMKEHLMKGEYVMGDKIVPLFAKKQKHTGEAIPTMETRDRCVRLFGEYV